MKKLAFYSYYVAGAAHLDWMLQAEQSIHNDRYASGSCGANVGQTENLISFLLGSTPSDQLRGRGLRGLRTSRSSCAGTPTGFVERRPHTGDETLIAGLTDRSGETSATRSLGSFYSGGDN